MATIQKRNNSYKITVSCGYDMNKRQIRKAMTWKPEPNMSEKQIEKELQRQATLFEERCLKGQVLDENIRFSEFAEIWMNDRKKDLRPRTYARYESMLPRINAAIGHIKLCRLQPMHLREFYNNLAEGGIRLDTKYKCKISIDGYLRQNSLTTAQLCRLSGISNTTMVSIRKGNNINLANAEKLAAALQMPLQELFTPDGEGKKTLSGETILHHHRLISAILHTAVEWNVLYSNPCDRTKTPQADVKEAKYIDEVQADALIKALEGADETHRTLIRLLLFTGMRRSEALGLKWSDVDFESGTLNICRSLQYLPDRGLFEDKTKNKSSERCIRLSQIAINDLREYKVYQMEQRLSYGSYWKGTEDYIFTSCDGKPLKPDSVSSWFSKFMKAHPDIPYITLHSLRHTNATLQIAAGVPITTVSKRLGHSNTETTGRIYAHAIKSSDDTAAEKLDDIFNKKQNKTAVS